MALRNICRDESDGLDDVRRRGETVFAEPVTHSISAAALTTDTGRAEASRGPATAAPPMTNYVRLEDEPEPWKDWAKRQLLLLRFYAIIAFIIGVLLGVLLQEICYLLATWGCSPSSLGDYKSPFGDNLIPDDVILLEEYHYFWKTFLVTKTDSQGLKKDMVLGYFYQIWGPFAFTTAFRDSFGHTLFASVKNIIHFGASNQIYRCDGKDNVYTLTESSNWLMNRIRRLFGSFRSSEYNIYHGDKLVAISDKIGYTSKSLLIHEPESEEPIAEASLTSRVVHGAYDEWVVHQRHTSARNENNTLPAYVSAMATSLMAFHFATQKVANSKNTNSDAHPSFAARPRLRMSKETSTLLNMVATNSSDVIATVQASLNTTATDQSEVATSQDAFAEPLRAVEDEEEVGE